MGGAEPLVLEIHKLFPNAPIYTSVYDAEKMQAFKNIDVRTTYLQEKLPKALRYKHVLWPVLRAKAFRALDLSEFDIIISSSSAEAKSVRKTRPGQVHIAYVHTPPRYYWSHYEEFRKEFNFGPMSPFIRPFIPFFVKKMRKLDLESSKDIDIFIANSTVTQQRIKEYYDKPSTVVYPPIEVDKFTPPPTGEREGYILWGRHVPYKRFDLAIQTCNELGVPLTVVGSGPDTERLKSLAGPTITFTGRVSDEELVRLSHTHKAFLFPNEEDFGMSAVEALAAGMPVIAYKKGGALDIVQEGETGVFFEHQTPKDLIDAIKKCEALIASGAFRPATLHRKAKRFDKGFFATKIRKIIEDTL
ncbi:glycosyltransferase [Candidatus Saccharibacteria bacterium TM7i]|nr:glycosyltransferase [Candidatus Saccharibacteria bacterium TM7i]